MRTLFLASLLPCLLLAVPARASVPSSIYSVPSRVDILPDDATGDRVVIDGKVLFLQANNEYSDARCGILYFRCPPGREAMCRMQWQDLREYIGRPQCGGFGPQNVVSQAMLRTDRGALGTPDLWDLGVGIQLGVALNGKCQPAVQLRCGDAPVDAGTPDVRAPAPDLAPVVLDGPAPSPNVIVDAAVAPPDVPIAANTPDAPLIAPDVAGTAPPPKVATSSACAMTGGRSSATGFLLLFALLVARRARRR